MWKQVMPLFVVAVLVGWFMPAEDPVAKRVEPAAVAETQATKPAPFNTTTASSFDETGGLVLTREPDGHFYAPGNVNGAGLRFLVDTGASVVALTQNDAEQLGQYVHPGELTVVGRGVNGEVMGKAIMISRLSVGDITADNVRAVIIPEGLPVSLLGQSFLSRIANVTINSDRMTLKN